MLPWHVAAVSTRGLAYLQHSFYCIALSPLTMLACTRDARRLPMSTDPLFVNGMSNAELVQYSVLLHHARGRLRELAPRAVLQRLLRNLVAELLLSGLPGLPPSTGSGRSPVTDFNILATDSDAVARAIPHVPEQFAAVLERGMDGPLLGYVKDVYDVLLLYLDDKMHTLWQNVMSTVELPHPASHALFTSRFCREVR